MWRWRKWNPFAEMDALWHELDRAFHGNARRQSGPGWPAFLPASTGRGYPLINVAENDENVYVEVLAPGLDPGTIDVSVKGGSLTVAGEKKAREGIEHEVCLRNERSTGKFVRTVELGTEVDASKVSAEYGDGLLKMTLPKAEQARPKQIPVNVN